MRLARSPARPTSIDHDLPLPLREAAPEQPPRDPGPIAVASATGERPRPWRWARRGLMVVCWSVLGFAFVLVLSVMLPNLFGMRDLTVLSGSMEPTIHTGDVVVEHEIHPLDAQIGDVVSFKDPEDPSILITHRVQDIQVHKGVVAFVTKGDANTGVEHWNVSADGMIGRVDYHVWRLGYLLFWIRGRMGRILLMVLPALLLGAYELLRIWRPEKREVPDEASA
jgi:signal peptidase